VVQPDIAVVELIERNINDHEIVEQDFQELELAMRDLTVGFMSGYRNQNSFHPSILRMMCSYTHKNS
jgi:hypothetical protein